MNIVSLLDQIDFDQTKPPMRSVGVLIRKITSYLYGEIISLLEK